jgi:hypothetical protein
VAVATQGVEVVVVDVVRTMYAPNVYMRWERGSAAAIREIQPTLEAAKAVLDAEMVRAGKPALEWTDEFGGASATVGELGYEVIPVQVNDTCNACLKGALS